MKRALIPVMLVVMCACTGGHPRTQAAATVRAEELGPMKFRAIAERAVAAPCVDPPQFEVAAGEDRWIDIWDEESMCKPSAEVDLPEFDATREVGVAIWWTAEPCRIPRTVSIAREAGQVVTVTARTRAGRCRSARGRWASESFLALTRSCLIGERQLTFRFVLDGRHVGETEWVPDRSC